MDYNTASSRVESFVDDLRSRKSVRYLAAFLGIELLVNIQAIATFLLVYTVEGSVFVVLRELRTDLPLFWFLRLLDPELTTPAAVAILLQYAVGAAVVYGTWGVLTNRTD